MKDRIIENSIRMFGEKGFNETSIQDVVDVLGVTKGTFYYYFTSKEQLLMDIHLQYIDNLLSHQEKIMENQEKDSKSKLYEIIFKLISDIEKQGLSAKVFFREMRNLSEDHLELIVPKREQFRKNIQQVLEDGIVKKEFRSDLPAEIVSLGILGMANWSYFWFNPSGKRTDSEVSGIFLKMLLEGIQRD
ncbi:TetR family transcriptional regulator [Bacillus lacus]|uniref:TetR family transcriptional regulator n=1 Tax=Metabacillus lacus TaxID=1983721 RepID=A0A7X2IYZ9_9BACI|nr:TetR/AcrR family transcriptional regulator [Metabacillus lacus]MRX72239.1 TetR family transcriptional regulator [Metabacillus lacus]